MWRPPGQINIPSREENSNLQLYSNWWANYLPSVVLPGQGGRRDQILPRMRAPGLCTLCNRYLWVAMFGRDICRDCQRITNETRRQELVDFDDEWHDSAFCLCRCQCGLPFDNDNEEDEDTDDSDYEPDSDDEDMEIDLVDPESTSDDQILAAGSAREGSAFFRPYAQESDAHAREARRFIVDRFHPQLSSDVNEHNQVSRLEASHLLNPLEREQMWSVINGPGEGGNRISLQELRERFPELYWEFEPLINPFDISQVFCHDCRCPLTRRLERALRRRRIAICIYCRLPVVRGLANDPDWPDNELNVHTDLTYCVCRCRCNHDLPSFYGRGPFSDPPTPVQTQPPPALPLSAPAQMEQHRETARTLRIDQRRLHLPQPQGQRDVFGYLRPPPSQDDDDDNDYDWSDYMEEYSDPEQEEGDDEEEQQLEQGRIRIRGRAQSRTLCRGRPTQRSTGSSTDEEMPDYLNPAPVSIAPDPNMQEVRRAVIEELRRDARGSASPPHHPRARSARSSWGESLVSWSSPPLTPNEVRRGGRDGEYIGRDRPRPDTAAMEADRFLATMPLPHGPPDTVVAAPAPNNNESRHGGSSEDDDIPLATRRPFVTARRRGRRPF